MRKRYKASLALGISLLGAGFSYPYASAGFLGGMVHNGFLAASIGGLADWFAVTALFRKPLGISYRTQILTRNRERIMNAIVEFASEDLLSVKNIMKVVKTQDTARMLVDYLRLRDGRQKLLEVLDHVLLSAARQMDCERLIQRLRPILKAGMAELPVPQLAARLAELLASSESKGDLRAAVQKLGLELLEAETVQQFLLENISQLRKKYEAGSAGRAFVLGLIDLSDEKILQMLCRRCGDWLDSLSDPESAAAVMLEEHWMALLQSAAVQERIAVWLQGLAAASSPMEWEQPLSRWLSGKLQAAEPGWLPLVNALAEKKLNEFSRSEELQQRYDHFVKKILEERLQRHHPMLEQLIQQRLDEFTDEKLTEFVESRIADDLQMIRINGSLVGSLVGMLLYAVVFCIERVYA